MWELPKTIDLGGKAYPIRWQCWAVLDVLTAYNDPELSGDEKTEIMLRIIYPDFHKIPSELLEDAVSKACDFIDCGQKEDSSPKPRVMDWSQDAGIIIPAINKAAGMEVRSVPDLHWWTFWGYFMSIGESLFSTVIHIRKKKQRGKELDKWEKEFYQENRKMIDLRTKDTDAIAEEKANILKWLDGGD